MGVPGSILFIKAATFAAMVENLSSGEAVDI
jgi:hypothetical protein